MAAMPATPLDIDLDGCLLVDTAYKEDEQVPWIHVDWIGSGGFAVIEIVRHRDTGIRLARKSMKLGPRRPRHRNVDIMDAFKTEIACLRRLAGHKHIVHLAESYTQIPTLALILHPVANGNLDDYLEQFPPQNGEEGGQRFLQTAIGCLASTLAFMHSNGIRHKDIKPQNILVHGDNILFTDFGLGLDFSESGNSISIGQYHSITHKYAAQEIKDFEGRGRSSDVFSLGCVFLEITTVLDGKSLDELDLFLVDEDDEDQRYNGIYSSRLQQSTAWMRHLQGSKSMSLPLRWCFEMMQHEPEQRPRMSRIVDRHSDLNTDITDTEWLKYSCTDCQNPGHTTTVSQQLPSLHRNESQVNNRSHKREALWCGGDLWETTDSPLLQDTNSGPRNAGEERLGFIDLPLQPGIVYSVSENFDFNAIDYRSVPVPKYDFVHSRNEAIPVASFPTVANSKNIEKLDPTYRRIRNARRFFRPGRVFKMLWIEPAGATRMTDDPEKTTMSSQYSMVMFNEFAYTSIRRFVIVQEGQDSCLCLPISTYGDRGTTKRGVDSSTHAIIYTSNIPPELLATEEGMTKDPIGVQPEGDDKLAPTSRVNFGKVYTVEHNVKVKGIGMVTIDGLSKLMRYWRDTLLDPPI
ncbi:MAG: hypothetical protein M1827_003119 [Pycnora praestabilis]|nr:MAG: hypothetical protein M1827_003119 [Pycnora praestabilis]